LLSLLVLACPCAASPVEIDARVVWVRGDQVYVAAPDSIAVGQATTLTFVRGKKTVATGEVVRVLDRALALAHVTFGALGEKHLERVRILAEPPRAPRLLRVGYPARGRGADPFVACEQDASWAPAPPGTYRIGGSDRNARLIRLPDARLSSAWPETLQVWQFDDAADEEIALERGELDVGVFWPGELSTHMREHPRWRNRLSWSMGAIAAERLAGGARDTSDQPILEDSLFHALNQTVFRGDLRELWNGPPESARSSRERALVRYEVDRSCYARQPIERFLAAVRPASPRAKQPAVMRLFTIALAINDVPLAAEDAIGLASKDMDVVGLFSYDCQVVFDQAVEPAVTAVGAGTLVNLFRCGTPASR
jgi:hypothetical protein